MAQLEYDVTRQPGRKGQLADNGFHDIISRINDTPRAAQITTVTVSAVNNATYDFMIDGVAFTYTADGTATTDEIIDDFVAQVNADPLINPRVVATKVGATLVLTALTGGIGFVYADSDANLAAVATQANAEADPVDFGALIFRNGTSRGGKLATAANLTALIATLTPAVAGTAVTYTVDVTVDGITYKAAFTDDGTPTVAEIVTGLHAILTANLPASVTSTDNTTDLLITAATAGQVFTVGVGSSLAAATLTVAFNSGDDINQALGVAVRELSHEEIAQNNGNQYPAGSDMSVIREGRIIVETEELVNDSMDVYWGVSVAEAGKWRGSAAAGYLKLDPAGVRWSEGLNGTLAVLKVNL